MIPWRDGDIPPSDRMIATALPVDESTVEYRRAASDVGSQEPSGRRSSSRSVFSPAIAALVSRAVKTKTC
jgi:hypothetical protein